MVLNIGIWARIGALGVMVALSGCSTMLDMAGVQRTGHQSDGTYVVSEDEEKLACRQIHERMDVLGQEISVLPERVAEEEQNSPRTVGAAFARMFGAPDSGLKSVDRYKKAVAERDALNALYARKRCF